MTLTIICVVIAAALKLMSLLILLAAKAFRKIANVPKREPTKAEPRGKGKAWEQDEPYPECFDEIEDDL